MIQNRYPGLRPFSETQKDIFFGREKDIINLVRLINLEQLVILYSKSGIGKSSIINAGLLPKIKNNNTFVPILIRFGHWTTNQPDTPIKIVGDFLFKDDNDKSILDRIWPNENSLWYQVKKIQLLGEKRPLLLIFDQFEELFSYPKEEIRNFQEQLNELHYGRMPRRFDDILEVLEHQTGKALTEEEEENLITPVLVKFLFAIRSDRLHLLNRFSEHLPTLLKNTFELKALSETDAKRSILAPANHIGVYSSPPFIIQEDALAKILSFLKDEDGRIDPVQLQVLCEAIEERVKKDRLELISLDNLGDLNAIVENYYNNKLKSIDDGTEQRRLVAQLIEDGLIHQEEHQRVSLHESQIQTLFRITPDLLQRLIDLRLLRREAAPKGGFIYELSHDTLVEPALRARSERKKLELELVERQRKQEQEITLQKEKRKRRNAVLIAVGASLLSLITLVALIWALNQRDIARKAIKELSKTYMEKGNQEILHLNYDQATELFLSALQIDAKDEGIHRALLEIIYVFNEANDFEKVMPLIDSINKISPIFLSSLSSQISQNDKRAIIKNSYAGWYNEFEKKYYPQLVQINGGQYTMGCTSDAEECESDELPPKIVDLNNFSLADKETTFWQFNLFCMSKNIEIEAFVPPWGTQGDHPAVKVDWYSALEYANWVSLQKGLSTAYVIDSLTKDTVSNLDKYFDKKRWFISETGNSGFRLPYEAEWEYAALGARKSDQFKYSGSQDVEEVAWYYDNSIIGGQQQTHPAGELQPNNLGLYDMSGNVWEWCSDWYNSYSSSQEISGPNQGIYKVIRGGAANTKEDDARSKSRSRLTPDRKSAYIGFRLAQSE